MKRGIILLIPFAAIVLIFMLAGCGGGSQPTTALQPRAEVSIGITSSPSHMGAAETYLFTATVTNTTNTAVTWSTSGCTSGCGTISETGLYTAPPFVANATSVTIVATSQADPTKSASFSLPLRPISVYLAPSAPANIALGGTRNFTVTLDHDPKDAGVAWALSGAGCAGDSCGTLNNVTATSALYLAPDAEPSPHTVMVTATSVSDPNQEAWVALTVSATPFLLEGQYAFLINGWGQRMEAVAGQFTADGKGNLTGVWDANRGAAAAVPQAITGTYNLQPDGHGSMTIQAGSATFVYILSLGSDGATRLVESTVPASGTYRGASGYVARQDTNAFKLSSLEGDRVIAVYGEATGSHVGAVGRFTATSAGVLNNGVIDLSWQINENVGGADYAVSLAGSFGVPDASTGRGTAALTVIGKASATYNFAYYIVSGDRILLVQTDARGFIGGLLIPMLRGEVRYQNNAGSFTNASFNAPVIFHLTDSTDDWAGMGHAMVRVGDLAPNGSGSLGVTLDQNVGGRDPEMIGYESGGKIMLNVAETGTYKVSANGRVSWTFPKPDFPNIPDTSVAYLVDHNRGYFMTLDLDGAGFGAFEPQTGGPFAVGALAGSYVLHTGPAATQQVENDVGWMTLDENGNGMATLYVNTGSGASPLSLTAAVTVASNGRGTLVLSATSPPVTRNLVFWAISPDRWVAISTVNPDDTKPALLFIERQ